MSNQPNPSRVQSCISKITTRYNSCKDTCKRNKDQDIKRARETYAKYQAEADARRDAAIANCDAGYNTCMGSAGSGGSGIGSVGLGGFVSSEKEQECRNALNACKQEAETAWQSESADRLSEFLADIQRAEANYQNAISGCFDSYREELISCIQTGHSGVVDGLFDIVGSIVELGGMLNPSGLEGVNSGGIFQGGTDIRQ
jgi:hypothetical protein